MQEPAEDVSLSSDEVEGLLTYVRQSNLPEAVAARLEEIIRTCLWLVFALQERTITLKRLRRLLFGKALKASPISEDASTPTAESAEEPRAERVVHADASEGGATAGDASPPSQNTPPAKPKGGHRTGMGRLGADAYVGAERVECRHDELAAGQRCPVCGQGSLYDLPPGVEIRIDGHALLSAIRYELQKLRCSACGAIFTAPLPDGVGKSKYSPRARAALVVSRYYLGLPFYRLEGYQAMQGVPVADATQWDQIEAVAQCCYGVFGCLETLAAQGELMHQDDTTVRILTLMKENEQIRARAAVQGLSRATERTGMFTTALVVRVGERLIALYYSGRAHAGENLAALLNKREADQEPPLVMSDALSRNDVEEGLVVRCHCLAHGRRQFSDLEEMFPSECRVVIETLKAVFDHEEVAREQAMRPAARLAYHQTYSEPLMNDLKEWLDQQINDRLVEPNSALGKAITYMRTHWETLTRFVQVEGVEPTNNTAERSIRPGVQWRKGSFGTQSEAGSRFIESMMTVVATLKQQNRNVLDYLTAAHEAALRSTPAPSLLPAPDQKSQAAA